MPKRATEDARPGPQKASRSASGQARSGKPSEDEMGEFEDAWEDEIDNDDDDDDDAARQGGDDGMRVRTRVCDHFFRAGSTS
jgi:ribosome assembly protein RRB1